MADGRVLFVPMTAPGDRVRAEVTESKARFARGRMVELLEPSPHRVDPQCEYFGRCGGCSLQHLGSDAQRAVKRQLVHDHLVRPGHASEGVLADVAASPLEHGYRHRMRYHAIDGKLGLFRRGSKELVSLERCTIASPAIQACLGRLAPVLAAHARGWLDVEIVDEAAGVAVLILGDGLKPRQVEGLLDALLALEGVHAAEVRSGSRSWKRSLTADLDGTPLGSFRQANPAANGILKERVTQHLAGCERVLELYAGSGNFSFALAGRGVRVTALENDARAVKAGEVEARRLELPVEFVHASAGRHVKAHPELLEAVDAVLVNPPRTGLGARLPRRIAESPVSKVVYVSCNPATLGRDVGRFVSDGFEVRSVEPVDLFPQTEHVECVAVLEDTRA